MIIERRENIEKLTVDYKIKILGFTFYRTLTKEEILDQRYPLWHKMMKWLQPKLCKHDWTFNKHSWANLSSHYHKQYWCGKCQSHRWFYYRYAPNVTK